MAESSRWTTERGDEWWFSSPSLEASAGFNRAPPALVIGELHVRGKALTASSLHFFLWRTQQQFRSEQLWLLLTSTTRSLVDALATAGHIRWELICNPLSQEARILFVSEPGKGT